MSVKQCLAIIAGLILLNISTILYFLYSAPPSNDSDKVIASVGSMDITKAQLDEELYVKYGQDTLKEMVDDEVIQQQAEKNNLTVTKEELEMEWRLRQLDYGYGGGNEWDEDHGMEELKLSILFEKLLTKDVEVSDEEVAAYLEENEHLYHAPDLYRVFHIVVSKREEAESVRKDLKDGAALSSLAMEYSPSDSEYDLGLISLEADTVPDSYKAALKNLREEQWSEPVEIDDGYAVLYVDQFVKGQTYTEQELNSYVSRRIGMSQLDRIASVDLFWDEGGVDWVYEQ